MRTVPAQARIEAMAQIAESIGIHRLALDLDLESAQTRQARRDAIAILRKAYADERDDKAVAK